MSELLPVEGCDLGQELIDVLQEGGGERVDRLLARGRPGTDHYDSYWSTFDCRNCPFSVRLYQSGQGRWKNAVACSLANAAIELMIAEAQIE